MAPPGGQKQGGQPTQGASEWAKSKSKDIHEELDGKIDEDISAGGGGGAEGALAELNHVEAADSLFENIEADVGAIETEAMTPRERAYDFMYIQPPDILAWLAKGWKAKGDYRTGLKQDLRDAHYLAYGFKLSLEEEAEFVMGLKAELIRIEGQLYAEDNLQENQFNRLNFMENERNFRTKGPEETDPRLTPGPRRSKRKTMKMDGILRQETANAFIRFADRRKKGKVEAPEMEREVITQQPKHERKRLRSLLAEHPLYVAELVALVVNRSSREISEKITRRLNQAKMGQEWEAIEDGLRALGIYAPQTPKEKNQFRKEVRRIFNIPAHQTVNHFFNKEYPDLGATLSSQEVIENKRKFTRLQRDIFLTYLAQRKHDIPVLVAEKFSEIYDVLQGKGLGEGMEANLGLQENIPREIKLEIGARVLSEVIENYLATGHFPQKNQEWFEHIRAVQGARSDLEKKEDGTYHYKKKAVH